MKEMIRNILPNEDDILRKDLWKDITPAQQMHLDYAMTDLIQDLERFVNMAIREGASKVSFQWENKPHFPLSQIGISAFATRLTQP